ncbi:phage portal protein [Brevibacterium aurantiacum]|nr:phage portal protein [Brevibacterium aurantiacum]
MPLPTIGTTWPPADQGIIFSKMREWQAWWAGDTDTLREVYTSGQATRPSMQKDGLIGAVKRFFWGRQNTDLRRQEARLHIPLAGDICQASADLLFAEPITVTNDKSDEAQERLDSILDEGFHSTVATSAEIGAALGGTFLRVVWDSTLSDTPFIDVVDADYAAPEFRWGRLTAVTFYFIVGTEGQAVFRHAERHELDATGNGVVYHGLYKGTSSELGRLHPLTDHAATEGITVDAEGKIDTGSPGLAAVYVPNVTPSRGWRKHPVGRNLGRSDLDGVEGLLDSLDETYSSWMRDIRLGKARILAGRTALEDNGLGNGATFDLDREVYEAVNVPPGSAKDSGLDIETVQFAIRFEEHQQTAQELTRNILRSAGYSPQTFGEQGEIATTATEVSARDRRTTLTKGRKERHWKRGIRQILQKLVDVDQVLFNGPGGTIAVEFPDGQQDSQLQLAQTAQALATAQAASTRTLVQMVHPDWDETAVDEEVGRIKSGSSMSDPDRVGYGGFGLSDQFEQDDENDEDNPSFPTGSVGS